MRAPAAADMGDIAEGHETSEQRLIGPSADPRRPPPWLVAAAREGVQYSIADRA